MKLYTEEQVNIMLNRARLHKQDDTEMFTNEYLLSEETPIELPSDVEINKESHNHYMKGQLNIEPASNTEYAFKKGAKWMKEQLL